MLTFTITNVSSTISIGAGTTQTLPAPFDWFTITASGTKTGVIRVQDLLASSGKVSGFTVADELQKLVQQNVITISFANLAATKVADAIGDAISNET